MKTFLGLLLVVSAVFAMNYFMARAHEEDIKRAIKLTGSCGSTCFSSGQIVGKVVESSRE